MSRLIARMGFDRLPRGAACSMMRHVLYGVESGAVGTPTLLERHRRGCLSCQAATVRQRRVIKELGSWRYEAEPSPHDITVALDQPLGVLPEPVPPTRRPRRQSMRAAAVSAAAIGVVVLAGRRIRSQTG